MKVTKNLFLDEYEILDIFNEEKYDNISYEENNTRIYNLNYVYILDKKSFNNFKKKVGILDDMIIEENEDAMANEENENGCAANLEKIENKDLLDLEKIEKLKYNSENPNFNFLNILLKKVDEKEMVFLNKDCFTYILRACPEYKEIKKVIYKSNNMLKIELNTPVIKILFLDNRKVLEKEFNHINYEKYILEIPITRFISGVDFSLYLIEIVQNYFHQSKEELQDFRLFLPENFKLETKDIRLLLKSRIENKLVPFDNFDKNEIYENQIFIFAYNNAFLPWEIDFKIINEKNEEQEKIIAIEDDPNKIFCANCKEILNNIEQREFCLCGNIYCNEDCMKKNKKHECEPKNCEGCQNLLNDKVEAVLCNCGAVFCKDECLEENNKTHIKTCFAYEKISKAYESRFWGRMEIEEEDLISDTENDGKIGLNNIGNTCYMNSALQCILHNPIIKKKFLSKTDLIINENNPLGTRGELLEEFKNLIKKYWFTKSTSIRPSGFKMVLSRHLNTFEGYSQHDSQEFCSQFLDSLHEDLNRIINKPYTQTIEGKIGDNEQELARASWINFLKRNYSFIVDNFFGQFRSLLECPKCDHSSLTYDPYQVVSLSIPSIFKEEFIFYLDKCDNSDNLERYEIEVQSLNHFKDVSIFNLKETICKNLDLKINNYEIGLFGNKVAGKILNDCDTLESFYENKEKYYYNRPKIFLTELNSQEIEMKNNENKTLPIYLRINHEIFDCSEEVQESYEFKKKYYYDYDKDKIHTKITFLHENSKIKDLYENVFRKLYFVTSLNEDPDYKKIKKNTDFFKNLWEDIVENQRDKKFFYLKINNEHLDYKDKRPISEIFSDSEKIIIQVFIRIKENTTVEVKLEEFLYTKKNYDLDSIKISSKDISNYTGEYSLKDLLENFSNPEILDKKNTWYCSKCKEHVQAKKTLKIYKLPKYLIIHLKKLKMHHQKVPLIKFPLENLNMESFTINKNPIKNYKPTFDEFYNKKDLEYYKEKNIDLILDEEDISLKNEYKCFGVVNHYGGQHFGHYTSACRVDEKWFKFDDSNVYGMDEAEVVSDGAYLLFYERV